MTIGKLGPRVLGEEKYREERETVRKKAHKLGPRVVGTEAPESYRQPPGQGEVRRAAGADDYVSVRELQAALGQNPALVDVFLKRELGAEQPPRKTALQAMWDAEHKRPGGARQPVLDQIRAGLEALEAASEDPEGDGGDTPGDGTPQNEDPPADKNDPPETRT